MVGPNHALSKSGHITKFGASQTLTRTILMESGNVSTRSINTPAAGRSSKSVAFQDVASELEREDHENDDADRQSHREKRERRVSFTSPAV